MGDVGVPRRPDVPPPPPGARELLARAIPFVPAALALVVPFFGPVGWLVPSAIGTLVYGAGCAASVRLGWPWVWPIASVLGAGAYSIASILLVDELVC